MDCGQRIEDLTEHARVIATVTAPNHRPRVTLRSPRDSHTRSNIVRVGPPKRLGKPRLLCRKNPATSNRLHKSGNGHRARRFVWHDDVAVRRVSKEVRDLALAILERQVKIVTNARAHRQTAVRTPVVLKKDAVVCRPGVHAWA